MLQDSEHTPIEKGNWADLADRDVILKDDDSEDNSGTISSRMSFIHRFALLADPSPSNHALCMLCQLDPTAEDPGKLYPPFRLERHLAGTYHDRHDQVARANREAVVDNRMTCHLCGKSVILKKIFWHWKKAHPEIRPE
jgi:hypothetical protein